MVRRLVLFFFIFFPTPHATTTPQPQTTMSLSLYSSIAGRSTTHRLLAASRRTTLLSWNKASSRHPRYMSGAENRSPVVMVAGDNAAWQRRCRDWVVINTELLFAVICSGVGGYWYIRSTISSEVEILGIKMQSDVNILTLKVEFLTNGIHETTKKVESLTDENRNRK